MTRKIRIRTNSSLLQYALLGVALSAMIVAFIPHRNFVEPEIVSFSTDRPDEKQPSAIQWKGTEKSPKKLRYEALGINNFIQNVGSDQNNQIAVPDNIHIAGWFTGSAQIGEEGLSIIGGHVDGWTEKGIFTQLIDAKIGDELSVSLGDGTVVRYKVFEYMSVEREIAAGYLFSQSPKVKSQLNLITCGGEFDKESEQYKKRIIVYAEKI